MQSEPGSRGRLLGAAAGAGCLETERKRFPREEKRPGRPPQEGCESEVALESFYLAPNSEPSAPTVLCRNSLALSPPNGSRR